MAWRFAAPIWPFYTVSSGAVGVAFALELLRAAPWDLGLPACMGHAVTAKP